MTNPIERLYNAIFGEKEITTNVIALENALAPHYHWAKLAEVFPEVFEDSIAPRLGEQADLVREMLEVWKGNNSMRLKIREHMTDSVGCWCVGDSDEEFDTEEEAKEFAETYDGEDNAVWYFQDKYYELYSDDPTVKVTCPMAPYRLRATAFIYAATKPELFSKTYDYNA